MNNKVKIKVNFSNYFYSYLISKSIKYENLIKNNNYYYLIVDYNDYKRISLIFDTYIVRYYGIKSIKYFLINNLFFFISFFISLLLLSILCNTIFSININCDDSEVKKSILNYLSKNDISVYKSKKDYYFINNLKDKLINEHDSIDWIEISENGSSYNVDVILKKDSSISTLRGNADIIASKDGLIKHLVVYNGTKIKEENEYVKKGEVIIDGSVSFNDTLVKEDVAKGEVYAEVWYVTNVSIPLNYTEFNFTGKSINHYYIDIFNKKFTLTGLYKGDNTFNEKECILDKPYLFFKLYKENIKEYKYNTITLSRNEAYSKGIELSDLYINDLLDTNEYVISKKVLKKEENSSKIYLEVFYKIYENIGETLYY